MSKSSFLSISSLIVNPILVLVVFAGVAAQPNSVRSSARVELPQPWNQVTSLTPEQRDKIQEILANTENFIAAAKPRIVQDRTEILRRLNALQLAKMDIAQWTKDMIRGARDQELIQIVALLNSEQQREAAAALAKIQRSDEIVEFQTFKARQQNDYFCWAACLQMLFNYAGVDWDQDKIANEIKGTSEAQTATPEEISKKGSGWRFNLKDPTKNWSADIAYHKEVPPGGLVVGMIQRNNFIFVELGGGHVGVLYKVSYRDTMPYPTLDAATIYDPLTGKDLNLKWPEEANKQITGWWQAMAINSPDRVFESTQRLR
jgi:hypothetical protein